MSRGISIKFSAECPHCHTMQSVTIITIGEIEGDTLHVCSKCRGQFAIVWSFEVEADIFKCDKEASKVQCDFSLSEDWEQDDDDDDE